MIYLQVKLTSFLWNILGILENLNKITPQDVHMFKQAIASVDNLERDNKSLQNETVRLQEDCNSLKVEIEVLEAQIVRLKNELDVVSAANQEYANLYAKEHGL